MVDNALQIVGEVAQPFMDLLESSIRLILDPVDDGHKYTMINSFEQKPFKDFDVATLKTIGNQTEQDDKFWQRSLSLCTASSLAYEDYSVIRKYTSKWGFTNVNIFDTGVVNDSVIENRAFFASSPDVVLLSFGGTQPFSMKSWLTNFLLGLEEDLLGSKDENNDNDLSVTDYLFNLPGKVHHGWKKSVDFMWVDIVKGLSELENQYSADYDPRMDSSSPAPSRKIWICGHSQGGSLAAIATSRFLIQQERDKKNALIRSSAARRSRNQLCGLYTFGEPMVGDDTFAKDFNTKMEGRSFRIVNEKDLVTTLPNDKLPHGKLYIHHNHEIRVRSGKWLRSDSFKNRFILSPMTEGLKAHFPAEYKQAISFAKYNSMLKKDSGNMLMNSNHSNNNNNNNSPGTPTKSRKHWYSFQS